MPAYGHTDTALAHRGSERAERSYGEVNELVNRLAERLRDGQSAERSDVGNPVSRAGAGLPLDEFLQTATDSVLRAVDAREKRLSEERGVSPALSLALRVPIWFGLVIGGQALTQVGAQTDGRTEQ
jgi:hypothetical protein